MLNQFENLSCYEEFEIQSTLTGISKIDILTKIGYKINNYYFFISNDGIFNWYDLNGNHIENPGILKELTSEHIPVSISKCIIPNGVTNIGYDTFAYCASLNEITIPDSVTHIGDDAFYDCSTLKKITIPDSVTSIGEEAFYECKSLKEITILDSVTSIGCEAFSGCESLTSITIPNSVTSIGYGAFYECNSLKEIIFKGKTLDEVKRIGNYPFGIEDENVFKVEI